MNLATDAGLINGALPEVRYPTGVVGMGVDSNGLTKSPSPVIEFIADEEAASICPLLTPSPPTEFEHPLSLINPPPGLAYERQISPSSTDPELSSLPLHGNLSLAYTNGLPPLEHNDSHSTDDNQQTFNPANSVQSVMLESSSSSSSVLQEPTACAQLLSSHHYQHFTKASDADPFTLQENGGKPPLAGIQLAVRKSTKNYCFMDWNWPLIRKLSFWSVMSLLMACVCIIVALIAQLPSTCNPPHGWWQGTLFYEIFPASFQDSNSDGHGDLLGIAGRATYLQSLGVRAVRLNSIFLSEHYPEHYDRVQNLTEIAPNLGDLDKFHTTVKALRKYNISIILDLPIHPFVKQLSQSDEGDRIVSAARRDNRVLGNEFISMNKSDAIPEIVMRDDTDVITEALNFWLRAGVDGFYLKGLEYLTDDKSFAPLVRKWRNVVDRFNTGLEDGEKILMCSIDVLNALDPVLDMEKMNAVLNRMDLIDAYLDLFSNGTHSIKKHIEGLNEGLLYQNPGYPWIHWHLGSVDTKRIASQLSTGEGNLAAILFHMMLPGTPSIFYGDEIGLLDYIVPEGENYNVTHPSALVPMHWTNSEPGYGFTAVGFPWINPSASLSSVYYGKQDVVRTVAKLREISPSIYMNGVLKDHKNLPNTEIRIVNGDIILMERWYPRRHSYVVVSNLGPHIITRDLSAIYYGGEIIADQHSRTGEYIKFHQLVMHAGESIIIKLDK